MFDLVEDSLGKRQRELNLKVRDAFNKRTNFDEIKLLEEKSDVNRLFKIDLAILYKNVEYIVDTLKCGDSLYVSRALKCPWLYDNEFEHVMNPEYLHQNVFPFMSTRMKKKTLSAIVSHITQADKADIFYKYCVKTQMDKMALDFLVKTSDSVKLEYLNNHFHIDESIKFEQLFGNSIEMIEFYLNKKKTVLKDIDSDLTKLRYFYSVSPEKYLNLLERFAELPSPFSHRRKLELFGLRISKDIMVNHKSRVLDKPWLYINKLNKKIIIHHSTSDNAKIYLKDLLPDIANKFWSMNYYGTYKEFFQLLPAHEIFPFLKQIFLMKYPNDLFEMDIYFYRLKYYELMTAEERNKWALKHLEQKKELLGPGEDYRWYQFVPFNKAFIEIKKLVYGNTNAQNRAVMLEVLVYAASTKEDLEQLLTHYYDRHVNEDYKHKKHFIDTIINVHNVFEFNDRCWNPIYKVLLSLDVLSNNQITDKYPMLAIVYNILNTNKILENLMPHSISNRSYLFREYLEKLNQNQQKLVYQCFMNYFEDKLRKLKDVKGVGDKEKKDLIFCVENVLIFMDGFKKSKDDCPKIIMDCVELYWDEFKNHKWFKSYDVSLSEGMLLRLLKKDKLLLVNKLPDLKCYLSYNLFLNLKSLLRKIKIYFSNDVAKTCVAFFEEWLLEKQMVNRNLNPIIFSLFLLGDTDYKVSFMLKHAPTEKKIQHDIIDNHLLKIQEGICRFAFYSRPPVPLSIMLRYIQGDYVHFCLPMFNSYLVNLPMPQSIKFTEAILNTPVSIQKHGLRMAFVSYEIENLKKLISNVWNNICNVSLRALIYKALFDKTARETESTQTQLYEILKKFTAEVNEQDQDEVFELFVSSTLPAKFKGDYLQTAWTAVRKFSDETSINTKRKTLVIRCIEANMQDMDRTFCRRQIIDDHIQKQFSEKQILHFYNPNCFDASLIEEKWNITMKYITHFEDDELKSSLEVLQLIMQKCLEMWDEVYNDRFIVRSFVDSFIHPSKFKTDYRKDRQQKPYINPVFENIIETLEKSWPEEQLCLRIWDFKLNVWGRSSIGYGKYNDNEKATTYDHLSVIEVSNNFASQIVSYINYLLKEQRYPNILFKSIGTLIEDTIKSMVSWTKLNNEVLTCHVSYALAKTALHEAHVLALAILPITVPSGGDTIHSGVINTIKECNNFELNVFLFNKFVMK